MKKDIVKINDEKESPVIVEFDFFFNPNLKTFLFIAFRERGRMRDMFVCLFVLERGEEREKHQCERETSINCFSYAS